MLKTIMHPADSRPPQPGGITRIPGFALLAVISLAILSLLPVMDYHYYADAARAWWHGHSKLYDAAAPQFFYFPWSLVLIVPLSFLTDRWGQAVFNVISLACLIWAVRRLSFKVSWRALALSLATPFTAAVLYLGQWDGLIVAGVALGWHAIERHKSWLLGVAFVILATKPTNAFLPAALLVWAMRTWPPRDMVRAALPPGIVLAGSFFACGADWPLRYAASLRSSPPLGYDVSVWTLKVGTPWLVLLVVVIVGAVVHLVRKNGVTGEALSYALAANLVVSPFVVPYHYVTAAPALAVLANRNWRVAAMVWILSAVLFRAFLLRQPGLHLVAYPLILLTALLAVRAPAAPP